MAIKHFAVLAILALATAAAAQEVPTVDIAGVSIAVGESYAIPILLSAADNGVAGYEITLAMSDTDVAEFSDATYTTFQGIEEKTEKGSGRVVLAAIDSGNIAQAGSRDILLGYVFVTAKAAGSARIVMESARLDDDNGDVMGIQGNGGQIIVSAAAGQGEMQKPAAAGDGGVPLYMLIIGAALAVSILMLAIHWYKGRQLI